MADQQEPDKLVVSLESQGDTGTASTVKVAANDLAQLDTPLVVRARICDEDGWTDATNATIAPATDKGETRVTHSATKDLEIESEPGVAATQTLTISGTVSDSETATIGERTYEFDTDRSTTLGNQPVDISARTTAAQGTLTFPEQPIADQTMTVGSTTYTFKATQSLTTEIAIGATLADTQANIVARINGRDQFPASAKNSEVSIADFSTNTAVLTARTPGTAGNSIATTDTMADVAQVEEITCVADTAGSLDGKYCVLHDSAGSVGVWIDVGNTGTTVPAGASAETRDIEVTGVTSGDTATAVATAVASALNADAAYTATSSAEVVTVTQATAGDVSDGADGDAGFSFAITTQGADSGSNGFDAATLGTTTAGTDCSAANAVTDLVAEINADPLATVSAVDGTGDTADITANAAGTAANSTATTETMTNGAWGAATMTGGVDANAGEIEIAVTNATAETATLRIGPADFGSPDFDATGTVINITHAAP